MVERASGRMALRSRTLIANRARVLRKDMTEPEVMLWSRLRGRGEGRPVFRRQHPLGAVILDFYCPAAKLAVEIDGSAHWTDEKIAKDEARDRWLAQQGIEVLRIGAGEVYRNLGQVADGVILSAIARIANRWAAPTACPLHHPLFGGRFPSPEIGGGRRSVSSIP
jgi:very-short-patch-repair endonuclease